MKKGTYTEIAVIVAGIDEEYQHDVLKGIISFAKEQSINISVFTAFGGVLASKRYDTGEYNIYNLVNYDKFDGIILLTNTICNDTEREKIIEAARASSLPTAVLDDDSNPEFFNIRIDNRSAMEEIVRHVITVHNAKTLNFISGPLSNPEARDRYNAFISVTKEYGIDVSEDRIYYGLFRNIDGKKAITQFIESGLDKPDAIICANDAMALATIAELESRDFRVPEDIIVTGFDNTYTARHHYPALTTVSRPLKDAGYCACKTVFDAINNNELPNDITLDSAPIFTESCGCSNHLNENIHKYKKGIYKTLKNVKEDISLINRLTSELAEAESTESDLHILEKYIVELQCEKFCICLCSEWEGKIKQSWDSESTEKCQVHGYTPIMSAPLVWINGKTKKVRLFRVEEMYPIPNEKGGCISYFMPLHFRERCIGYYIITNSNFPSKSMMCHSLMMNISNSIENVRKLMNLNGAINELNNLYIMDPLCKIYNRNGFMRMADKMFEQCQKEHGNVIISFIDMDGLKYINDTYGHQEGDNALRCLADVITECCNKDRICARFGGDEFIIFGINADEADIEPLEKEFTEKLNETNSIVKMPYEIQASMGTIVTKLEEQHELFNLITQADSLMYAKKKRKKTSRYLRR